MAMRWTRVFAAARDADQRLARILAADPQKSQSAERARDAAKRVKREPSSLTR